MTAKGLLSAVIALEPASVAATPAVTIKTSSWLLSVECWPIDGSGQVVRYSVSIVGRLMVKSDVLW